MRCARMTREHLPLRPEEDRGGKGGQGREGTGRDRKEAGKGEEKRRTENNVERERSSRTKR